MNNLTGTVVLRDTILVGKIVQLSGTLDDQMFHNGSRYHLVWKAMVGCTDSFLEGSVVFNSYGTSKWG